MAGGRALDGRSSSNQRADISVVRRAPNPQKITYIEIHQSRNHSAYLIDFSKCPTCKENAFQVLSLLAIVSTILLGLSLERPLEASSLERSQTRRECMMLQGTGTGARVLQGVPQHVLTLLFT